MESNYCYYISFIPLPKSATPSRIRSNAEVYDFELDEGDMKALDALDRGKDGAISWNPIDAEWPLHEPSGWERDLEFESWAGNQVGMDKDSGSASIEVCMYSVEWRQYKICKMAIEGGQDHERR